jgi:HAD superfamily hydrolase (TIGR01490 family)
VARDASCTAAKLTDHRNPCAPSDKAIMAERSSAPVVAFFDLDNTFMHGASAFFLVRGLRAAGLLTMRDVISAGWKHARFKARGENDRHLNSARARGLAVLAGVPVTDMARLADDVYDRHIASAVWPEMYRIAQEHLANGHHVWLMTATPSFLADVIALRLGLTGSLGSRLEVRDGRYTGRIEEAVLHGDEKAAAARGVLVKADANPTDCWAYSDSRHDIPLLSLVGHPVVVNPDPKLAAHARASDWRSMRLRPSSIREARRQATHGEAAR